MESVVIATSSMEELQTEVQPELLRGVPLDVCMGGCGRHFERPDVGMFKVDHRLYQRSKQMSSYHSFLSHDWGTNRWLKFMSLMIIYNSRAAFVCSLLASLLVGILRASGILPSELWVVLSVCAVFPVVLCFWQRIRTHILQSPVQVFFDKMCIAQHDEELCTYEISTFLRDPKPKPILVMPAKLAAILLVFSAASQFIMLGFHVLQDAQKDLDFIKLGLVPAEFREMLVHNTLYLPFLCPVMLVLHYIGLGMIAELAELPNQLKMFKVQDTECFCCSSNHCHPENGKELQCDRVLMFKMLRRWYGKPTDEKGQGKHLERFNKTVQEELAPKVLQRVGSDMLPWNYSLYVILPEVLPQLTSLIPKIAAGHHDLGHLQVIWAFRLLMDWAMTSIIALFWIRISTRLWLLAVRYAPLHCQRYRLAWAIVLSIPAGLLLTLILFTSEFSMIMSEDDSMLPLIPFAFWLLLLCFCWSSKTSRAHLTSSEPSMHTTSASPASPRSPTSPASSCFDEAKGVEMKEDSKESFAV